MSIPKHACPITHACLHIVRQSRDTSPTLFNFSEEDKWGELEEEASANAPSNESQRLRAFYAIEVIYHELLPQLFFSISDPDFQRAFMELRASRSVEGLDELLGVIHRFKRKTGARRTILKIKGNKNDNSQQLAELLKRPNKVLEACASAVEALKKSLRSDQVRGLSTVGQALANSFIESSESQDSIQGHLTTLLTITAGKAVTPWNRKAYQA